MPDSCFDYESALQLVENDMKDYPLTLQPKHIAEYLSISLSVAYKMFHSGELPAVNLPHSKLIVVPKSVFTRWYANRLSNDHLESSVQKGL